MSLDKPITLSDIKLIISRKLRLNIIFINYEILVCNSNPKIFKDILVQLNKIGFKQNQVSHIKF